MSFYRVYNKHLVLEKSLQHMSARVEVKAFYTLLSPQHQFMFRDILQHIGARSLSAYVAGMQRDGVSLEETCGRVLRWFNKHMNCVVRLVQRPLGTMVSSPIYQQKK